MDINSERFYNWQDANYIMQHEDYAEPGYGNRGFPILTANWNDVSETAQTWLEQRFELEWSDEWSTCGNCYKLVRISGDCWDWKPFYTIGDGELTCGDCIVEYPDDYVESLIDNPESVEMFDLDLKPFGFEPVPDADYENGMHPGQTDNPIELLAQLQKQYPGMEFIFTGYGNSQFCCTFSAAMRPIDQD